MSDELKRSVQRSRVTRYGMLVLLLLAVGFFAWRSCRRDIVVIDQRVSILAPFHVQSLIVDFTSTLGAVGTSGNVGVGVTNIDGPTRQTVTIPGGGYNFGELNLATISGLVPDFPHDLFVSVIRNTATADTTAHASHTGGYAIEVNAVHNVGANPLVVTAIELDATVTGAASGGDTLEAIRIFHGDIVTDSGNVLLNGTSSFIFQGGTSGFIAAAGTIFPESNGTNAIDISGAPTNQIKTRAAASHFDIENAAASTLTFYNANFGTTTLELGIGSTPTAGPKLSNGVPTVSHGSVGARSTNWVGNITGIGANTTVTLTFVPAFPNGSWCRADPNSIGTPEIISNTTLSASVPVFSCINSTTGAAANCVDFTYECIGN